MRRALWWRDGKSVAGIFLNPPKGHHDLTAAFPEYLMEGADTYQIAKNCGTSVGMIEKYYAVHIKTSFDAAAINVVRSKKDPAGERSMNATTRYRPTLPKSRAGLCWPVSLFHVQTETVRIFL
jgi:hypothetical protein